MLRLTREVRFAVNAVPDRQLEGRPGNSFAGFPSLTGAGQYFVLAVTLTGHPDPKTGYLLNIKQVDRQVRETAIPFIADQLQSRRFGGGAGTLARLFGLLRDRWPGTTLNSLTMNLTPFLSLEVRAPELPMVRLSQKFEFSASHRLHNPTLTDDENRAAFGKCNNPHGHGHNYALQVTLAGQPDENGVLINVPDFERIVSETVIDRFDHRNLNVEVPEFRDLNPSVENIAMVIYRLLEPKLQSAGASLASVTVWETPKTWSEYSR